MGEDCCTCWDIPRSDCCYCGYEYAREREREKANDPHRAFRDRESEEIEAHRASPFAREGGDPDLVLAQSWDAAERHERQELAERALRAEQRVRDLEEAQGEMLGTMEVVLAGLALGLVALWVWGAR